MNGGWDFLWGLMNGSIPSHGSYMVTALMGRWIPGMMGLIINGFLRIHPWDDLVKKVVPQVVNAKLVYKYYNVWVD